MAVLFDSPDYDSHEQVVFHADEACGLKAIIAVHDTRLGPALGGVRMWRYANEALALRDVLRLSRGMTYKSALAGLALGGGKAVILGDPRRDKSKALLRAMGRFVERLGGRYIAAEDSGTSVADLEIVAEETAHVAGVTGPLRADGSRRSGDPSPSTARGVLAGIRASVAHRLGRDSLDGVRVAVQGVGNVGLRLARHLAAEGASLFVTDVHAPSLQRAVEETGATPVGLEKIHALDVDVFSPCGLGGAINDASLPELRAPIVAGAANNQLERAGHGTELHRRGILYAPDYVINAGGIIDIALSRDGAHEHGIERQVDGIGATLLDIYARASQQSLPTNDVADAMARARLEPERPVARRAAG